MDLVALYQRFKKEEEPLTCGVVIVAAGSAQRMGFDKMTAELDGMPVLVRTVQAFEQCPLVEEIVIVTRSERLEEIAALREQYHLHKVSSVVLGGKTRTESSLAGVMALKKDSRLIAIHDGARPLVSQMLIEACIRRASVQYAAIPVIRSTDTLRQIDDKGALTGTCDRDHIVRVQTPQVFLAEVVKAALTDAVQKGLVFTDDATAVERLGMTIQTVEGEEENLKLTTPQDMILAESILQRRKEQKP